MSSAKSKLLLSVFLTVLCFSEIIAKSIEQRLWSPDKKTEVIISLSDQIRFSVNYNAKELISQSVIGMQLENEVLGQYPVIRKKETRHVDDTVYPVVRIKNVTVRNQYNELQLIFKNDYALVFRAFNNGIAYRFETEKNENITVVGETGIFNFPENYSCWWGTEESFQTPNQVYYTKKTLQELGKDDLASLPLVVGTTVGPKIVITETDLSDYPGMWINGADANKLSISNPRHVKNVDIQSDREIPVTERYNYIAKTKGTRTFPWRIFAIAEKDKDLVMNQMSFLLASENRIEDTSWIKPGKVAWDWWNGNNFVNVDFRAGFNTQTYKYYIDFAARYGIEYVMLDEGWYVLGDLTKVVPGMDMEELSAYAEKKGVGLLLWCVWKTLDDQMDAAFDEFKKWGIKGIKVDFMKRDDQWMVNFFHRVAAKAAENKMLVDFHGAHKPAGLLRMYPNVMTYEGVKGEEQLKWDMGPTPEHDLMLPFCRMLAGPMDYTPGAMTNAQKKDFKSIFNKPMSMGTRCHQLALYVVFDSPLQMLCDSPTRYYQETKCMKFLSDVPTVWDESKVLAARMGDYLLMARRNGNNWYVGGMTDWDARTLTLDLSFLPTGKKYTMTLYRDGINADRNGNDFKMTEMEVGQDFHTEIHLAPGGGIAAMLHPVNE